MKCPECGNQAIKFTCWAAGSAALKTTCDSCGVELKGNATTWIGMILTITAILILMFFFWEQISELKKAYGKFSVMLLAIIPAFVGGVLTWFVGGYKKKE